MDTISFTDEQLKDLPPKYKTALLQMIKNFNDAESLDKKLEIIRNFSGKFLLILHLFDVQMKLEQLLFSKNLKFFDADENPRKTLCFVSNKYGRSEKLKWENGNKYWFFDEEKPLEDWFNEPEKHLTFPHMYLSSAMSMLEEAGTKPISKSLFRKYERSMFLYKEFMRNDLCAQKFLKYLKEDIEDDEIVIGLIEHRLGWKMIGCIDKSIWQFYISFLRTRNPIAMLNVYRRYTRFFVEDFEMIEKYRNEIERISKIPLNVAEFWIDTILYEFDFGTNESISNILERALNATMKEKECTLKPLISDFKILPKEYIEKIHEFYHVSFQIGIPKQPIICKRLKSICHYYPRNEMKTIKLSPNFDFPRTMIYYITKTANSDILQNLFQLCKYFFAVHPILLCHRLVLGFSGTSKYIEQSLFLNEKDLKFLDRLKNSFFVTSILDIFVEKDTILANTLPKLGKISAQYGTILNQELTIEEFKKIYPYGHIYFCNTHVFNEDLTICKAPHGIDYLWKNGEKS